MQKKNDAHAPVRCQVFPTNGHWYWHAPDGEIVFQIAPGGAKEDLRKKPVYAQLLPCPYCGAEEDRGHDPLKHVNPALGVPVTRLG